MSCPEGFQRISNCLAEMKEGIRKRACLKRKGGKGRRANGDGFEKLSVPSTVASVKTVSQKTIFEKCQKVFSRKSVCPVSSPRFDAVKDNVRLCVTWLGHTSVYADFGDNGPRVLFDPVFEDSFVYQGIKSKRVTPTPCKIKDIPSIDMVIISNSHPRHLSCATIKRIQELHPSCRCFVPLGCKDLLSNEGITRVTELDWWERRAFKPSSSDVSTDRLKSTELYEPLTSKIECLPCQYEHPLGPKDRLRGIWASWSVESDRGEKLFFVGATAYRDVDLYKGRFPVYPIYKHIGWTRGPFDVVCAPIGGYRARYMWASNHSDPYDAVNIFRDVRGINALAIGYGTWATTAKDVKRSMAELDSALKEHDGDLTHTSKVPHVGVTMRYGQLIK